MRQIACPVCNQEPNSSPEEFSIIDCPTCQVKWTFISAELDSDALYEDEVYAVVDNRQSVFEKLIFREARIILNKGNYLLGPSKKRLLDFGCGKGQFLAEAKKLGWNGIGIETARDRAVFAVDKYQVEVIQEFYSHGKVTDQPFDLITLNHVLEHLPAPISMVKELIESNLAETGLLYIEVPRTDSWQANIAGTKWLHWDIPKHLNHWKESGLVKQFEDVGYKKVGGKSFSIHLGVLGMLQALFSLFGYNDHLILALKKKKSVGLMLGVALLTPVAFLLESLASAFGKSGIVGVYFKKNG
ncbi:class I SAM-dependent methyltransferase [Algoriphagus lutimaris]|uniref:class I SAM-dependent methyltransferase n=1 Tax=Algoriphagus lutimaris TaxID=613197 RepID=UPI00196B9877|nr:class I SAM-dependent methyltransferase [Algoriphagus lutimaris]MBN3520928.1 class I SAM-dependent methyltransferase [Algoriphagus lutimaris]